MKIGIDPSQSTVSMRVAERPMKRVAPDRFCMCHSGCPATSRYLFLASDYMLNAINMIIKRGGDDAQSIKNASPNAHSHEVMGGGRN